jgi:hypothetical protein
MTTPLALSSPLQELCRYAEIIAIAKGQYALIYFLQRLLMAWLTLTPLGVTRQASPSGRHLSNNTLKLYRIKDQCRPVFFLLFKRAAICTV